MNILFLDDDLARVKEFTDRIGNNDVVTIEHVLTRAQFCEAIKSQKWDLIMLDHDLGYHQDIEDWNGSKAAKILAGNRSLMGDNQQVIIHSTNSSGVLTMMVHMKHGEHLNVSVVPEAWKKVSYSPEDGVVFKI